MGILPSYPGCFVCGQENVAGTNVTFIATPDGVQAEYTALERHQSYKGILHGGVIGALLDECLGWAVAIHEKKMTVTGELKVRYLNSISVGTTVQVKGYYRPGQSPGRKYFLAQGHVEGVNGTIYTRAEGRFFQAPDKIVKPIMQMLEYKDTSHHRHLKKEVLDFI